jgi:NAD(P)-dependent dehydrogenase (short-subunit alcohol dehydrogenase family)
MPPERTETAQGHEQAYAVHVLGPHLMLHLLRETLVRGAAEEPRGAAVVWMSSGGMYSAGLRSTPETIEYLDGDYEGIRAYARTKRMQVVLADRWARSLTGTGVQVESMHPGWAGTPGLTEAMPGFGKVVKAGLRDARGGADTAIWLVATRPPSVTPHFWHDRAQRPTTFGWQRGEDPAAVQAFVEHVEQATDVPVGT